MFASQQITEQLKVESGCFCGRVVHSLDLNATHQDDSWLLNRMIVEAFKWLHLRWPDAM